MRGFILVGLRQYDHALEQVRIAVEIAPEEPSLREHAARIYWLQGRVAETVAEERHMASLAHSERWERGLVEVQAAYEKRGVRSACLKSAQLKKLLYEHPRPVSGFLIPAQFGDVRDDRKVLEWLDRLLRERGYANALLLKTAPEYDFLRGDPRFRDLLRRAGLPQ